MANNKFITALKPYALEKGLNLKTANKKYKVTTHQCIVNPLYEDNRKEVARGEFIRVFLSKHSRNWFVNLFNKSIFKRTKTDIKLTNQDETVFSQMALGQKVKESVDAFAEGTLKPEHIKKRSHELQYIDAALYYN